MAKLTTVEVQKGGGGGGGVADTSDNLEDMTNYEKAILKPEIFKMLGQLLVMEEGTDKSKYVYLKLDASDIPDLTAASMGAAGHAINSEFAALRIPFRAIPYASEDAKKVEKVANRGKNAGKTKTVKETNCLKIYRTGTEFDPALYAVAGGEEGAYEEFGLKTNDEDVVLTYENFTVGQKLRADKWLGVSEVDPVLLEDMGIVLEDVEEESEDVEETK